jgi:flagellin-like hook-associated protein FlgL
MINFDPKGSFVDFAKANSRQSRAISILASGGQEDLWLRDAGSFSMNLNIQGQVSVERKLINGMQDILSFSQVPDGHLNLLADVPRRMCDLASMATAPTKSISGVLVYNSEFMNLVEQFDAAENETFIGFNLFGSGTRDENTELLNSLKKHWVTTFNNLSKAVYGWIVDSSDPWDLAIEENGAVGRSTAFSRSFRSISSYELQDKTLRIDLPDLTIPQTVDESTANTLIAHKMAHSLHFQNTFTDDQMGGGQRCVIWLTEGLSSLEDEREQALVGELDFTDTDTGYVHESELDLTKNSTSNVMRDDTAPLNNFYSQLTFLEKKSSEPSKMFITADKDVSIFSPFSVVSLGDSKTYYINNTSGFTQAFEGNDSFIESVANLRATPGSNMGVTQNNFDLLLSRNTYLQNSISSNQDIDLAKETAELTRTELLLQMNHSVNVQAREISRNVTLALIQ